VASTRKACPAAVSRTERVLRSNNCACNCRFQRLDLAAEWRLRHIESLGRAPEVEFLRDGDECLDLIEAEHVWVRLSQPGTFPPRPCTADQPSLAGSDGSTGDVRP